jgi:hypothetical protein
MGISDGSYARWKNLLLEGVENVDRNKTARGDGVDTQSVLVTKAWLRCAFRDFVDHDPASRRKW